MEPSASPSCANRTVFIADDDDDLRLLLRLLIQSEPGFSVAGEARTGCDAFEAIAGHEPPDVLLVDVNMPRMDVGDALQQLRTRNPEIEVVVYSGEDEDVGRRRLGDIGPYTYVVKGRPERLLETLRRGVSRAGT